MHGAREALARGDTHRGGGGRRCIRPPGAAGAVAMERGVHGDGARFSWLAFAPLVRRARGWRQWLSFDSWGQLGDLSL